MTLVARTHSFHDLADACLENVGTYQKLQYIPPRMPAVAWIFRIIKLTCHIIYLLKIRFIDVELPESLFNFPAPGAHSRYPASCPVTQVDHYDRLSGFALKE